MNKEELRELAHWGMKRKLQELEAQLAIYFQEFPELFISTTRPVLLKAEPRENGRLWGAAPGREATPDDAPRLSVRERILAYLREHPPATSTAIARALDVPRPQVATALSKLKRARQVYQPDPATFEWALRVKGAKAAPPARKPGTASGTVIVGRTSDRILAILADGEAHWPKEMTKQLNIPYGTMSSTLDRLKRNGRAAQVGNGSWKARAGAQGTTGAQPALPLDGPPARRVKVGGSIKHPMRTKFWKERWYARLQAEGGRENITESAKALGTTSATLMTSATAWIQDKVLVKLEPGLYAIGPTAPATGVLAEAARALEARNGHGASA